ncbi:MAG: hypothetical protein CME19_14455 [Gemmatimonadetes bacterium]|nr:hypothetical protein [Gemmatimonadota bacterium]
MKQNEIENARRDIDVYNGYVKACTWLQCGICEGIGGPFITPGGRADGDWSTDINTLQSDAGSLW